MCGWKAGESQDWMKADCSIQLHPAPTQRLSSIYNFMHNIIPIREPGSSRAFWFKQ